MGQEYNVLTLCDSIISTLRNAVNSNISKELSTALNQKIFILETALDDFRQNHIDFEKICDHLINAICLTDKMGKILYVNQAYLDFSNLRKEDFIGKNISDICNENIFIAKISVLDDDGTLKYDLSQGASIIPTSATPDSYLENSNYNLKQAVEEFEKDIIRNAIKECGSKRKAATSLHMDHSTLIKKCQRYGI